MTDAGEVKKKTRGHVLVVDDLNLNRRLCLRILGACGYSADEAANGAEALEALKQQRYDAVLLDREMPVIDGLTAARMIRELDEPLSRIPILAISASDDPDDVQESDDLAERDDLQELVDLYHQFEKAKQAVLGRIDAVAEQEQTSHPCPHGYTDLDGQCISLCRNRKDTP